MSNAQAVGVVGASGRAAAGSLRRAGFAPWVVDLFADRDTRRIAPCARCSFDDYPHGLVRLCEPFPSGPVIYTGGLENYPDVIRELAKSHMVWGNSADVLERVRDPFLIHTALSNAHLPVPRVLPVTAPIPNARWIRKSRSSGGLGVRFARTEEPPRAGDYLQEFIDGPSYSAQFLTVGDSDEFVGVTEQLIGESWLHASAFRYAGNIGPVPISEGAEVVMLRIAALIATETALDGPWGIDFILHDGHPFVIEVNPRYTAAMEVIELATRVEFFGVPAPSLPTPPVIGKAIYFAPHRLMFPASGPWDADLDSAFDPWRMPDYADIPQPGEHIELGWPVLTFFAAGSSAKEVRERLQSRAAELDRFFAEPHV